MENEAAPKTVVINEPKKEDDKVIKQRRNLKFLERANNTQKAINDMQKRIELLSNVVNKLNDYYDANLRFNSVQQIAN